MSNKIKRDLPNNQYQAAIGANSPSALNVFATIADLTSGGGIQHGIAAGTNAYTVAIPGIVSYTDGDSYIGLTYNDFPTKGWLINTSTKEVLYLESRDGYDYSCQFKNTVLTKL